MQHRNARRLSGLTFGRLRAIEATDQRKDGKVVWRCVCACGKEKLVPATSLTSGMTRSCGCLLSEATRSDAVGRRYGRLTVTGYAAKSRWLCRCDCGKETSVLMTNLTKGTRSCGCLRDEMNTTHGMSSTVIYKRWYAMLERCGNPAHKHFEHYGGRGIKVCERWHTFENFFADMGHPPAGMSVDRIDVNKGYEPGNCRWATKRTQALNKRSARDVVLSRLSVADLEREIERRRAMVAPVQAAVSFGSQNSGKVRPSDQQ